MIPLRTTVVIVAFNSSCALLEADVIKPCKAGSIYILYGVVWNKEVFFPSHENIVCFLHNFIVKWVRIKSFGILVKWNKLALEVKEKSVGIHMTQSRTLTQCFLSTSSSASHFLVRNGNLLLMISPSKNVVRVGNSSVSPLIFR